MFTDQKSAKSKVGESLVALTQNDWEQIGRLLDKGYTRQQLAIIYGVGGIDDLSVFSGVNQRLIHVTHEISKIQIDETMKPLYH